MQYHQVILGVIQLLRGQVEGGQNMSIFVHAQGVKTVHTGGKGGRRQKMVISGLEILVHLLIEF